MSVSIVASIVLSILSSIIICESARILAVFPTPSISHQVVFRPLTQELARLGHEVIVLTPDPVFPKGKSPKNLTEIDVHKISYDYFQKRFLAHATGKKKDLQNQIRVLHDIMGSVFEMQLENSEIKKIIEEKQHFDLLLLEAWIRPALALSYIFKAPVIQVSSLGRMWHEYEGIGAPGHPFLYPICFHQRLYNLTKWEKINKLYDELKLHFMMNEIEKEHNNQIKRIFGPNTPNLKDLSKNIEMLFLNIHPIWEGNNPVPPTVIYTWGIHHKPKKQLPMDWKTFLDNSKHGVIYMSFGTNTDPAKLPKEKIQMFIKVFSELPYDILWKWNQDVLPGKTDNIRISKWFPQSDLLMHPNVKLFITQGGLQSTDEAITAGVPLIGIPMLGDQWYNTEKYLYHGIGLKLDFESLTEKELRDAVDEVIENESYRNNIIKLGKLISDQPQPALERAVWWVEYVIRHRGAKHLRAPAAGISWAKYLEIDLVLLLLAGSLVIFVLVIYIICWLYSILSKYFMMNVKLKSY